MFWRRLLSAWITVSFISTLVIPIPKASAALALPEPGMMVNLSPAFEPVLIKGLKVHPENPFQFDFIVDTGSDPALRHQDLSSRNSGIRDEAGKLIKYFLASLTIPEKDLWVNLSPYEKDRMIADNLGTTQMGQDMLAQDYVLKQLTASLIYPERDLGKTFWDKVYQKAQQLYGTTEIPVNTFNKVWIVADKADVFERGNVAYIVGAHLKVMLEEDYLAKDKHQDTKAATISSQIVKDVILPSIEQEVNQGKNFAPLRQMFYSMILASWYKMALKDTILTQIYGNQSKVKVGINANDPTDKAKIFEQYLKAYKKGVFNYIKEDLNAATKQPMPRKYFSGGFDMAMLGKGEVLHRNQPWNDGAITGNVFAVSGGVNVEKADGAMISALRQDRTVAESSIKWEWERAIQSSRNMRYLRMLHRQVVQSGLSGQSIRELDDLITQRIQVMAGKDRAMTASADLGNIISDEQARKEGEIAQIRREYEEVLRGDMTDRRLADLMGRLDQIQVVGDLASYKAYLIQLMQEKRASLAEQIKAAGKTNGVGDKAMAVQETAREVIQRLVTEDMPRTFAIPESLASDVRGIVAALGGFVRYDEKMYYNPSEMLPPLEPEEFEFSWRHGDNTERLRITADRLIAMVDDISQEDNKVAADLVQLIRGADRAMTALVPLDGTDNDVIKAARDNYSSLSFDISVFIERIKSALLPVVVVNMRAVTAFPELNTLRRRGKKIEPLHDKGYLSSHSAVYLEVDPVHIYYIEEGDLYKITAPETASQQPPAASPKDTAMTAKVDQATTPGGIDLNRANMQMNVRKEGAGVQMQFDPAMIERIKREGFDGLEFKIDTIVPITNLPMLLGLREDEHQGHPQLAGV